MQLCYIWVDAYKAFQKQGINLHPRYRFETLIGPDAPCFQVAVKDLLNPIPGNEGSEDEERQAPYFPLFEGRPLHQLTGLMGKNGSGKSTVFELIFLLFRGINEASSSSRPTPTRINELRRFLYIFEVGNQDSPAYTGPWPVPNHHCWTSFLVENSNLRFLLVTSDANCPMLTIGLQSFSLCGDRQDRAIAQLGARLRCIYYNHTTEDLVNRLPERGFFLRRKGYPQYKVSAISFLPENHLFEGSEQQRLIQGILRLHCFDSFINSRAKDYLEQIFKPNKVSLDDRVRVERVFGSGERFKEALTGFVGQAENSATLDLEKISMQFMDINGSDYLVFGNALACFAHIIMVTAPDRFSPIVAPAGLLQFLGEDNFDPTRFMAAIEECYDDLPEPLQRVLDRALTFHKHYRDVVSAPVSGTEIFFTLEQIKNDAKLAMFLASMPPWIDLSMRDNTVRNLSDLSAGERAMLNLVTTINLHLLELKENEAPDQILLLMDEADLGLHPEWQRKLIRLLHEGLGFAGQHIQLIYATHSPFIASDLPHTHLTLMKKEKGQCMQVSRENKTFGANIHNLLADTFFLESTIGALARTTLHTCFKFCHKVQDLHLSVNDPDLKENDTEKWAQDNLELKRCLDVYEGSAKPAEDERFCARAQLTQLAAVIGEAYLAEMLESHIKALDRITLRREV